MTDRNKIDATAERRKPTRRRRPPGKRAARTTNPVWDRAHAWCDALDARMRAGEEHGCPANAFRVTAEGLVYGTPRTSEEDWRFARTGLPADAFAPHADPVWAVLDRYTWFTLDDLDRLQAAVWERCDEDGQRRRNVALAALRGKAKSAGHRRQGDYHALRDVVEQFGAVILPAEAGESSRRSGGPRNEDWHGAMTVARTTAQALLFADRLAPEHLHELTAAWTKAFG